MLVVPYVQLVATFPEKQRLLVNFFILKLHVHVHVRDVPGSDVISIDTSNARGIKSSFIFSHSVI